VHPRRRVASGLAAIAATLVLGGCSSSSTGQLAVAMDPAGRLVAVVAVCGGHRAASLTLTDENTFATATVRLKEPPTFGGTVILTGPIGDPRPEGMFDLLDRSHTYTLGGATKEAESDKDSGALPQVRFKLDTVVRDRKLRQGSVLSASAEGTATTERTAFVDQARRSCG
jgi:hypothetical protein